MAHAGDSKVVVDLRVKVGELRVLHNKLTDMVILLKYDVEQIKKFVGYKPPTQESQDTQQQQRTQAQTAAGQKKVVKRIDN